MEENKVENVINIIKNMDIKETRQLFIQPNLQMELKQILSW